MPLNGLEEQSEEACEATERWLRDLPAWEHHPLASGGAVSGNHGPTILSEADCVLHFAQHLHDAGVQWEDMHLEMSLSKWIFERPAGTLPRQRIDLAVASRGQLIGQRLPDTSGEFRFDAFVEFGIGSNYWMFGTRWGAPAKFRKKVAKDIDKAVGYLEAGFCELGVVVLFEECDHEFPVDFVASVEARHPGLRVRILRGWRE